MDTFSAESFCTDPNFLKFLRMIVTICNIICVLLPIILIVLITLDIYKTVTGGEKELKDALKTSTNRIIASILVFFVPTIMSIFVGFMSQYAIRNISLQGCFDNIDNIEYYEQLAEAERQREAERLQQLARQEEARRNQYTAINNNSNNSEPTEDSQVATVIGQKYTLTDSQLRGLAYKCQREQSTVDGSKAEASLMANRFELYGSKFGTGGTGLYNYVADSGWFANARALMSNPAGVKPEIIAAVKEVLVLGKRTLPMYVDEHDCIDCGKYGFDIPKIVNGNQVITDHTQLKNHNNYHKDKTVIYNKYGSVYTFYTFPAPSSDPFGYTQTAVNKINKLNNSR